MSDEEIVSPYINTVQFADVVVYPFQLNNDLYLHLKKNLKDNFLGKCNKYGYVQRIYKINSYKEGKINPSNASGSVRFQVTYECSLCNPGIGEKIVVEISSITKPFIIATNGPIKVCIPIPKNINDTNFFVDNNGFLRYKDEKKSIVVKKKDFAICKIINKDLFVNNNEIVTIGILERMSTEDEIKKFYQDENQTFDEKKKKLLSDEMVSNELVEAENIGEESFSETPSKKKGKTKSSSVEEDNEEEKEIKKLKRKKAKKKKSKK